MKNAKTSFFAFFRKNRPIWAVLGHFRGFVTTICDRCDNPCHKFRWRQWAILGKKVLFLRVLKTTVTTVTFVTKLKNTVYQLVIVVYDVTVICFCVTVVTNLVTVTVVTDVTSFLKIAIRIALSRQTIRRYSWWSAINLVCPGIGGTGCGLSDMLRRIVSPSNYHVKSASYLNSPIVSKVAKYPLAEILNSIRFNS